MKYVIKHAWYDLLRLFQFLVFYGVGISALLFFLPEIAENIEAQYETLNGTVRLVAVVGFVLVIAVWQTKVKCDRLRSESA
jgi:hypothetical protein